MEFFVVAARQSWLPFLPHSLSSHLRVVQCIDEILSMRTTVGSTGEERKKRKKEKQEAMNSSSERT